MINERSEQECAEIEKLLIERMIRITEGFERAKNWRNPVLIKTASTRRHLKAA